MVAKNTGQGKIVYKSNETNVKYMTKNEPKFNFSVKINLLFIKNH